MLVILTLKLLVLVLDAPYHRTTKKRVLSKTIKQNSLLGIWTSLHNNHITNKGTETERGHKKGKKYHKCHFNSNSNQIGILLWCRQLIFLFFLFACPSPWFPCLVHFLTFFYADGKYIKVKGEFWDKTFFFHRSAFFKMIRWIYLSVLFGTTFWSVYVVVLRFSSRLSIFFLSCDCGFFRTLSGSWNWNSTRKKCKKLSVFVPFCLLM